MIFMYNFKKVYRKKVHIYSISVCMLESSAVVKTIFLEIIRIFPFIRTTSINVSVFDRISVGAGLVHRLYHKNTKDSVSNPGTLPETLEGSWVNVGVNITS